MATAAPAPPALDARLYTWNDQPVRSGSYVLYWCRAYRRANDNLALEHACARAEALGLPLVVYEALDLRYPFASARMHTFVLQGVRSMRRAIEARGAHYCFYLPRTREEARASRALEQLAKRAALLVTDWYPHAGGPRGLWKRTEDGARKLPLRVEAIDDAAVVPLSLFPAHEHAARTLRPKLHKVLEQWLHRAPERTVRTRLSQWQPPFEHTEVTDENLAALVRSCAFEHTVAPVTSNEGGTAEAQARLQRFVSKGIRRYDEDRNDLACVATSGLSAHLHFGHLSARATALAAREANSKHCEGFLEELLVRRALAFNHVHTAPDHERYEGLPAWARTTLDKHAVDPRPSASSLEAWEQARTPDRLWNAAQQELLRDGIIHPYARMVWGKVALTLARTPREAFDWLVYLNDKYALDGRDPNTYTNIAWCFGLHDHPYPERAIFGTVRCMTSAAAERKWDAKPYFTRAQPPQPSLF